MSRSFDANVDFSTVHQVDNEWMIEYIVGDVVFTHRFNPNNIIFMHPGGHKVLIDIRSFMAKKYIVRCTWDPTFSIIDEMTLLQIPS